MRKTEKHLKYFRCDPKAELSFGISKIVLLLWEYFSTLVLYLKFYCFGVNYGLKIKCIGGVIISKYQLSKISIGNKNKFISTSKYNLIGINRKCVISTQSEKANIDIGNNCGFSGTVIGAFKYIKIGNNVRCGANTLITDSDWHLDDPRSGKPADVIIKDNVWLGVNVVVLKGVTIGENSVIGANSVVTKDIPDNVIAAGNPCKVIKSINLN